MKRAMRGPFRSNARTRMEVLELIKRRSAIPGPTDWAAGSLACIDD